MIKINRTDTYVTVLPDAKEIKKKANTDEALSTANRKLGKIAQKKDKKKFSGGRKKD